jgi:acetyl esterase/lipase
VECFFLVPPDTAAGKQLVYLHGGAFTAGPVICHWSMLARVCEKTGISAILVDYGLAPERPFPRGLQDVLAVCEHLRAKQGVEAVFLMGDSAGGGLALSAALALKEEKQALPEKLVLLSPWLDLTLSNPEIDRVEYRDPLLERDALVEAGREYAAGRDPAHYLLSPVNGTLQGLPPTLLQIGTHDLLVSDCRRFRDKAQRAGVFLIYQEWEAMFHDWMTQTPHMPEANKAVEEIVFFLKKKRVT